MATFNKILLQLQQIDKTKDPEQRQQQIQALKHDVDVSENLKNKETVQRLIENILSQPKESSEQPIQLPEELGELRNIFEAYLKSLGPEKGKPILNTYATLLSYAKLAWEFESHNGIPEEHALKLSILFGNHEQALAYLAAFAKRNPAQQTVHDGCLFSVPESIRNIYTWRRMTTADNYSAMFKSDFKRFLIFSTELEAYINAQKGKNKEINEQLKQEITQKKGAFSDFNGDLKDPQLLKKAKEHLNNKIAALNKTCHNYETNQPKGAREKIGSYGYQKALEERAALRVKRSEFYAAESFKQFNLEMLQDIYIAYDLQNPNGLLSYFRKNNIPPAKYQQFLTLDRNQAGIHIPDISIEGQSLGLPGYYLKKINVQNEAEAARAACLGKLTNSCQSLSGEAGEPCAIHGLTDPKGGFYIVCKGDPQDPDALHHPILAQSWAWVNQEHQTLVLDSVEYPNAPNPQERQANLQIVKRFYEALATKLAQEATIQRVMIGTSGKTPEDFGYNFDGMVPLAMNPESPEGYTGYRDSKKQRIFALHGFPLVNIMACVDKSPAPEQERAVKQYFGALKTLQNNVPLKQWLCWYVNQDSNTSKLERLNTFTKKYIPEDLEPQFNNIITAIRYIQAECQKGIDKIDFQKLQKWANQGYSINFTNDDDQTVLMRAVVEGNRDVVAQLLKYPGIDINKKDRDGYSAIHYAVITGNTNIDALKLLLSHPNLNLNEANNENQTPLMQAVTDHYEEAVQLLLQDSRTNVNQWNSRSGPFLNQVLKEKNLAIILMTLDCPRVNLEERQAYDEQEAWGNAILYAIKTDHSEIINHVLSRNVNFLHPDKEKYWRLILREAMSKNKFDSIKLILDKLKANPPASDTSLTTEKLYQILIDDIIVLGNASALEAILKLDILHIDRKQSVALLNAAMRNCPKNLELFEILAQYSPKALSPEAPENWGFMRHCSPEVLALLINKNILSVNQIISDETKISSSIFKADSPKPIIFEMVASAYLDRDEERAKLELFLQHPDLNLNVQNSRENTPLVEAINSNLNSEIISAILRHPNCDLNAHNQGELALVQALRFGKVEAIKALQPYANKLGNLSDICAKYPNAFFFHFLIRAIDEKETPFLEAVLNWPNLDVNPIENVRHHTPLTYAIEKNATQHIDLLLNHRTIDINKPNGLGITPLEMAIRNGNVPLVTQLLRNPKIILDIPLRPQEEQSSKTLLESVREFAATERNIALDEALAMRAPSLQPNKLLKFSQDNSSSSPAADPDPKNPPSTPKKGSSS